jgi:hypothetical protein
MLYALYGNRPETALHDSLLQMQAMVPIALQQAAAVKDREEIVRRAQVLTQGVPMGNPLLGPGGQIPQIPRIGSTPPPSAPDTRSILQRHPFYGWSQGRNNP